MKPHLSTMTLDALDLGALDPAARAAAETHLAACERCRGELEAARAARARFERDVLERSLPDVLRAQRRRTHGLRRVWFAAPAVAAAALLLVLWPRSMDRGHDGLLVKGGEPALRVFARRDQRVFPVADGAPLLAGDELRFVVDPAGRRYVLIASVDGAGRATAYYPYNGAASAPLERKPRVELPGSIRLDAAPGPERIFALLSDAPLDAEPVLAELRALGAQGADAIRAQHALDGARARGATAQVTFVFEKARN